jgi:HPt (histidine-containing phosphotransfer) domain-containing protein
MSFANWDEKVLLDQKHLDEFTSFDYGLQNQVLSVFVSNAPLYLEKLCRPNNDNWRADAHKLKGAARSIGAWRLAIAAERAEKMAMLATEDPKRREVLKQLLERLEATVDYIRARKYTVK